MDLPRLQCPETGELPCWRRDSTEVQLHCRKEDDDAKQQVDRGIGAAVLVAQRHLVCCFPHAGRELSDHQGVHRQSWYCCIMLLRWWHRICTSAVESGACSSSGLSLFRKSNWTCKPLAAACVS